MNGFDLEEYREICGKLDAQPDITDVTVRYENSSYFNKLRNSVEKDRWGEVVFCVLRPNGKIIAITCREYPQGTYRIPTGGICYGEDIISAAFRETREELGLEVELMKFGGVIRVRFEHDSASFMFYSYIFILKETGGRLLEDASDDEISEVREVGLDELEVIADSLGDIPGKWKDWGKFRHITTKAVWNVLVREGFAGNPQAAFKNV